VRQHRCNDLVPQVAAPRSTRTHTVNDDGLWISDPAEIAEVYRFGSDPEFLQHNGVQQWSSPRFLHSPTGSHTRGRAREGGSAWGQERSQLMRIVSCSPPPLGEPLYRGKGAHLPPHQCTYRDGGQGRDGADLERPKTLTLGFPSRMGHLGCI
jgi:hypothetical protein